MARPAVTALVLTALLAGGCGSGDGPATTSSRASTTTETSKVRERFDARVRDLLTERGLDEAVIECSVERLDESVSDAEIEAAVEAIKRTGSPPASLAGAATEAGTACAGG